MYTGWVAVYVDRQPPAVWGPQQNAVVNGQLESAQAVGVSVAERARVWGVADKVLWAGRSGGLLTSLIPFADLDLI